MRTKTVLPLVLVTAGALLVPATTTAVPAAPSGDPFADQAVVTDVRVGRHATFDRFVVQFRKAMPATIVKYKKTLRMDGSGEKVDLKGRRNILVRLEPARAHRTNGTSTIDTTGEVVKFPEIREWRLLGDFEAVVTLGIGVRRKRAVEVTLLTHPKRLVIDVAH